MPLLLRKALVVLALLGLLAVLASSIGLSRPVNGQGIAALGKAVDLGNISMIVQGCAGDNWQEVFPNAVPHPDGSNSFTVPSRSDGDEIVLTFRIRGTENYALITNFPTPDSDGLFTKTKNCNKPGWNAGAHNIALGSPGAGQKVTITLGGQNMTVRRQGDQIWLEAGTAAIPSPTPQPQPPLPPSGGGVGGGTITDGRTDWTFVVNGSGPLTITVGGQNCQVVGFIESVDGTNGTDIAMLNCNGTEARAHLQVKPPMWFKSLWGCVKPVPGKAAEADLTTCFSRQTPIVPIQPVGQNCDLAPFQDRRGLIDDTGIVEAAMRWTRGFIDDVCMLRAMDLWTTGRPLGSAGIKVEVTIYDLNGRAVGSLASSGKILAADGRPLANGVYLYMVTIKGAGGQVLASKVKKIAVIR